MIVAALLLGAAVASPQGTTELPVQYARAESLITDGELKQARGLLDTVLADRPDDPQALTLLGRVYLNWPVVGRWKAWQLLRRAAELAPDDPDPWYWKMKVGKRLGSADGEALIHSGLRGVLERQPDFRDVWKWWDDIYHSPGTLRQFADILARYPADPVAQERRAKMLSDAEDYAAANTVLDALLSDGHDDGSLWAIRAQAALEAGDTATGLRYYDGALQRAASDTLGYLWRQIAPIAWPDEDSAWARTAPDDREAFFRAFWAKRDPDVTTQVNERIVEHFDRLRTAREDYRILHPQARFHHSAYARALMSNQAPRVLRALLQMDYPLISTLPSVFPGRSRLEDEVQRAGLNVDVRDIPEPDSVSRYRRYGFDGRGLVYIRFGEPARRLRNIAEDVEAWDYEVAGGLGRVVFARATAGGFSDASGGDVVLYPTNRAELRNSITLLTHDETSIVANADVVLWVAFFRGTQEGRQLVYVVSSGDTSAAVGYDDQWREEDRSTGASPHVLSLTRGSHHLAVDTHDNGRRGRLRTEIDVPTLWRGSLTLSSLLVGVVDDTLFTRDDVARGMPPDRRFPSGTPLAVYGEVYGLARDRSGRSRYQVEYRFEPIGRGQAATLTFERNVVANDVVPERVILQPGRVPPGRYRVYLTVQDEVRRRLVQSTFVVFELR